MALTRIKICGITRVDDALIAANAGVDAIGLVFYAPSPRAVTAATAAGIVASLPPLVSVVGLFVDATEAAVADVLNTVPLDVLQFHGDESAAFCGSFSRPYIKALRMRPDIDLPAAAANYAQARGLLIDSWQAGTPGGTGKTFDWQRANMALPRPMILAGGLQPDNVAQAIATLRPAAVDVSGGVESAPGVKSATKIRDFVAAVRGLT